MVPSRRLSLALLLLICVGGCAARRLPPPVPKVLARPSGMVPLDNGDPLAPAQEYAAFRRFAERNSTSYTGGPKKHFLALSGGGMYGAYSVGVLCGWSASGTRPQFDVVTGVSTGALIGTYAFLGSAWDRKAYDAYSNINERDIYRRRPYTALIWNDAYASSDPLKNLINDAVDDELLAAVARGHAEGRRLYIGTTNLDTRRMVIWDMTAIAASGQPDAKELYRKVLLASASPPGFLPPVPIEVEINGQKFTERHCDGGATTGVFLRASNLPLGQEHLQEQNSPLAGCEAYVVVAGKLYSDPVITRPRTISISESALQSLLYSQTRSELHRIYTLCIATGMRYNLTAVPEDLDVNADSMSFKPRDMAKLYDAGFFAAASGKLWRDSPPGAEPQEQTRPRSGTRFLAPER